ncbi:hypothetical protein BKA66DRAFT_453399 [Pyrenochaeta sp. MPI-SDFR-AT-0127]|nr:hypothetical protein BKA66DRAFT_453399 [Pyrenochaeta sp. MPI-SDFR-AT-0127]
MAHLTGPKDTEVVEISIPVYQALPQITSHTHEHQAINSQNPDDIEQLPLYSEETLEQRESIAELAALLSGEEGQSLPILASPPPTQDFFLLEEQKRLKRRRVVNAYFDAIKSGNVELVASFWGFNLVTTETTDASGKTPLLAAVEAKLTHMVRYLLDVGAGIDTYGIIATLNLGRSRRGKKHEQLTYRTPLQYAAQTGEFSIVKLLVERGADDALIAPDGQLALRLAAINGHREIVDYLPVRRGGGFRRWKTKHAIAMRRCERAARKIYLFGKFFVWEVPRFFLWSIPKHVIVLPLVDAVKWVHKHRHNIPKILADVAKDIAIGMTKFGAQALKGLKELPRAIWEITKKFASYIWRTVKRLPHGLKIALVWLWAGFKNTGLAIGYAIGRFFSFIHTVCAAIGSFFQRITLQDVLNAFIICTRAIFVDAPTKVWMWLCAFRKASLKALKATFGWLGECLWESIRCCVIVVTYVPEKIWEMLKACASSIRSGSREVMVWYNPKRV